MNENDGKPNKPSHFLIRPDYDDVDSMRQAAIDMSRAITGRDPTPEELEMLDASVRAYQASTDTTDPAPTPAPEAAKKSMGATDDTKYQADMDELRATIFSPEAVAANMLSEPFDLDAPTDLPGDSSSSMPGQDQPPEQND